MSNEATLIGQLREEIHRRLAPHRHTVLLGAIIAAFLVRPLIGDFGAGPILFSTAMLLLLLLLYTTSTSTSWWATGKFFSPRREGAAS